MECELQQVPTVALEAHLHFTLDAAVQPQASDCNRCQRGRAPASSQRLGMIWPGIEKRGLERLAIRMKVARESRGEPTDQSGGKWICPHFTL